MKGKVYSLNIGKEKGKGKIPVPEAYFQQGSGLEGDVHAGVLEDRQVSLLAWERIQEKNFCLKKSGPDLKPGDFAENITTVNLDLTKLKPGTKIYIGSVVLEVSKIGKECHNYCQIYKKLGSCLMPREGVFARVLKGGSVKVGDEIEIKNDY